MSALARAARLAASMAIWTLAYALVARHPSGAPLVTRIALDDVVPIWLPAIWLYMAPYAVAPILAARITDGTFAATLRRAWAIFALGTCAFLVVPTLVDRPAFAVSDDVFALTTRLHAFVTAVDTPAGNAAPSLHVALAVLLAWAVGRDLPRARAAGWAFAIAIAASTLLTRQHHLIDVVTGAALAVSVLWGAAVLDGRRRGDRRPAVSPSPRPGGAPRSPPPP